MAAAMKEKQSRQTKTTKEQYGVYVSFIEANKDLAIKKDSDKAVDKLWQDLTILLNASSTGPKRTTQSWKKIIENWRNAVRHKNRRIQLLLNATGGGPVGNETLKDIEEKALSAWGKLVVTGMSVVEGGFVNDDSSINLIEPLSVANEPQSSKEEFKRKEPTPRKRKPPIEDEILNKMLRIEEHKSEKKQEGQLEIANALQQIADSINNLAEVIYMAFKKN